MPKVDYLGDETGESRLLESLRDGVIDALIRGEVGHLKAARALDGAIVVTALDDAVELGGFMLAVEDGKLPSCLDEKNNYPTDDRRIGFAEWVTDSEVFMRR